MNASLRSLSSLCGLLGILSLVGACGEDGKDGRAGEQGEQGEAGPAGERGEPGEAGPAGERGEPGEAGPAGEPGPQGEMGSPGETGAQGETGAMGDPGAKGDTGTMGAKGDPGAQGEQGDPADSPPVGLSVKFLGRHSAGAFDKGAAEIVTFDKDSRRVFVVNALAATVDVLDITNPATPTKLQTIDVKAADGQKTLGSANSVSTKNGVLAVAIEASPKTDPGIVAFYATDTLALLGTASVGALPDMLTFTPDGKKVLVANEGEPSDDYLTDPEGSVSIVTLPAAWTSAPTVQTVDFAGLNADVANLRAKGVRVFGPNATVAQDFEPEYITTSSDGKKAWVTLQENNAFAIIDVTTAALLDVVPLGFKNHALLGNELDASDQDQAINIRNWPVFGMYLPDAIASYEVAGQTYLVTANEGDTRDYPGFSEILRVSSNSYLLDATKFPDAATLKLPANLGRLNVTKTLGNTANPNEFNAIYAFGARSFSVWTASGEQVYDSGSELELRTAKRYPKNFNASNTTNAFDNRSDDKGPEPEAVTIGKIGGTPFAFIGLERVGGVLVYDLTLPENPRFVTYFNSRDFAAADIQTNGGDLGPEASVFIPAEDSPTGVPLLVLGNEISGTTALFELTPLYGALP